MSWQDNPVLLATSSSEYSHARVLAGTANQVILNDGGAGGKLTLSLPQNIATDSAVKFGSLELGSPLAILQGGTGTTSYGVRGVIFAQSATNLRALPPMTNGQLVIGSTGADPVVAALTGTADQLTVTNAAGSVTLAIASPFTPPGALNIVSSSATAFTVTRTGTTYAFQVSTNTANSATGIRIVAAAAAGGVAMDVISSGTNEALTIDAKGSGTITLGNTSTGNVVLGPQNQSSDQSVIVGSPTAAIGGAFQIIANATSDIPFLGQAVGNNAGGFQITGYKTRGATPVPNTIVQNGDTVFGLLAQADDGSVRRSLASIDMMVDGTPGLSDMPGRIVFSTTPDGSATLTEAGRILNSQVWVFGAGEAGTPVNASLRGAAAVGTNIAGGTVTLGSGAGTGNAAASSLIFQTPTVGSTGSVAQTMATRLTIASTGVTIAPVVSTSGSPTGLTYTEAAHTTLAASTEVIGVNFNLSATVQFATGALTTQRAFVIQAPTYGFVGASTLTTAETVVITAAPSAGTNATITTAVALAVGGATTQVSASGLIYNAILIPAHTLTVTGTTQVTSSSTAMLSIGILTITDASAVTVDQASSLYISGPPVLGGSVTLTRPYSLLVDAGVSRFDDSVLIGATAVGTGSPTNVLVVANGTVPTSSPIDSVTLYSTDDTAGNTIPSFYAEGTGVIATAQADVATSVRVKMRINGTVATFLCL